MKALDDNTFEYFDNFSKFLIQKRKYHAYQIIAFYQIIILAIVSYQNFSLK